ncbi:MAG: helix-turn-helix domain-containing protein [Desulfobacteraceae bacterium]|nr:helix-turn-helix domain-containing protein [Desulfobacteraceae bacterium]
MVWIPLLYAAKKAIGPLQLTEDEARTTARRAYENNPRLTSFEIGQAIGRSRQAVDAYIADLRASCQMELDLKDITNERASHSTGANGESAWCTTTDYFYPFTKNAGIGKTCKY